MPTLPVTGLKGSISLDTPAAANVVSSHVESWLNPSST